MIYAQIHRGNKLHLVFEAENRMSQPICGIRTDGYRMTSNVPLAHACHNCLRIYKINRGATVRREFFKNKEAPTDDT